MVNAVKDEPETQSDLIGILRGLTSDRALADVGTPREKRKRQERIAWALDCIASERVIAYIERHQERLISGGSHQPSSLAEAKASVKKGTAVVSRLRERVRLAQEDAENARLQKRESAPGLFVEANKWLGKLKEAEKRLSLRKKQLSAFERKKD